METDKRILKYRSRFKQLRDQQLSWRLHWKDIADYTCPRKGEFLYQTDEMAQDERGSLRNTNIINSTAADSARILAAGMQGGMTSPSRPWFELVLPDKDLMKFAPVKQWLADVKDIILKMFARSNYYDATHSNYYELGVFGVASKFHEEDVQSVVRYRPMTIGEYMLTLDPQYRPAGLYRQFTMNTEQMIEKFGEENVSDRVKSAMKANELDARFKVKHIVEPNDSIISDSLGPDSMPYVSVYFEDEGDPEAYLRKKGYESRPFTAPRWNVSGTQTYGTSPGMDSLGDNRMIQKMEEKSLKALDKQVDPPMNADPSMRGKGGSIVPGHVNYVSTKSGNPGFYPTYQVNMDIGQVEAKIEKTENRIKSAYFYDLFLMVINDNRSNTTAFEIAKRHQERLMVLGPVISRIQAETLDPDIERAYEIGTRFGLFPEPPQELQGMAIDIEYVSVLAQAQKIAGTTSIEQVSSFIGNLGSVAPQALDKLDVDSTIEEYANLTGAPPKMIRGREEVQRIRQLRQQAAEREANANRVSSMIQGGKEMSDTKLNEESVLDRVLGTVEGV